LKKRTKKLLQIGTRSIRKPKPKGSKVFCFFFSKKKSFSCFLAFLLRGTPPSPGLLDGAPDSGAL
jgi:hypothetical protein